MERRIATRLGDGSFIELTRSEIEADLMAGSELGAKRSKAPVLGAEEIGHLLDIFAWRPSSRAVDLGHEVVPASTAAATPTPALPSATSSSTRTTTAPTPSSSGTTTTPTRP